MSSSSGNGHRTETPDVSHIRNIEVTHETSDVNARGVLMFIVVLTLATAAASAGLWYLFKFLNTESAKERPPGPMAIRKEEDRLPPEPRLQGQRGFEVVLPDGEKVPLQLTHPQAEYETLLKQWESALQTGVKDSSGNTVGVPIEEAMKRIVSGQGLPVRTQKAPGAVGDFPTSVPSDWSSGRETVKLK